RSCYLYLPRAGCLLHLHSFPTRRSSDLVIVGARLPEMVLQETLCLTLEIEPGLDTELRHLPDGRRPDAVKLPDRQRFDEGRAHFRRDHEKPVRLAMVGGEFGEELVVGHAG